MSASLLFVTVFIVELYTTGNYRFRDFFLLVFAVFRETNRNILKQRYRGLACYESWKPQMTYQQLAVFSHKGSMPGTTQKTHKR